MTSQKSTLALCVLESEPANPIDWSLYTTIRYKSAWNMLGRRSDKSRQPTSEIQNFVQSEIN